MKIVVTQPEYFESVMPRLEKLGEVVKVSGGREETLAEISDADALVARIDTKVDRELLNAAQSLKAIATATTGTNHIDMRECERRGVRIFNAAGINADAVAEFTTGLMINLSRNIPAAHSSTKKGGWSRTNFIGSTLQGKSLGIIGFGKIGKKLAEIAKACGMKIYAHDPFLNEKEISDAGAIPIGIEGLLKNSDFVSVHCNLSEQTKGLISDARIRQMKPTAFLINTSRGEVVEEEALLGALRNKIIAGAALDVFAYEPLESDSEILRYAKEHDNLIITPHIAGSTEEAIIAAAGRVCGMLEEYCATNKL